MKVRVACHIPAKPEAVIEWVQTVPLLRYISAPVITFRSLEPEGFPVVWPDGAHRVNLYMMGVLPLGEQMIVISRGWLEDGRYWLRDNGYGAGAKVWDHHIRVAPAEDGGTIYSDEVEIQAGFMTWPTWAFGCFYYRWRQYRWRKLARLNFAPLGRN